MKTTVRGLIACLALLVATVFLVASAAPAADYPNKPIQMIVPYGAGGSTDVLARAVAQVAPKYLSQPFVIVNKAGGGGIPGRVDTVRSRPDGYTIMLGYGSGEDLTVPQQRPLPYDWYKDFETVCRLSVHTHTLVVPTNSPHKTLGDLVKWAKTKDYVTSSVATKGSGGDIALYAFGKIGGFNMTTVPGSGGAEAITKLVGGHVDMAVVHPSEALPHIKAGRVRGIAVMFDKRDPAIPDIPTFKEAGIDLMTAGSVKGVAAPKGTPKEIVNLLSGKFKQISEDPEFQKIMKEIGQPVMFMGSDEYHVWLKQAYDWYAQLIKISGVEVK